VKEVCKLGIFVIRHSRYHRLLLLVFFFFKKKTYVSVLEHIAPTLLLSLLDQIKSGLGSDSVHLAANTIQVDGTTCRLRSVAAIAMVE
jgi:hypothetical protein